MSLHFRLRRMLVFIFFVFINSSFAEEFAPYGVSEASQSAGTSFSCGVGDATSCKDISPETLNSLDACAATVDIAGSISDIGFLLYNQYADVIFFQEIANRSVQATECQINILSGNRAPLANSAWDIYQTIQPLLEALRQAKQDQQTRLRTELQRSLTPNGMSVLQLEVRNNIERINGVIDQLLGQLPFGEHDAVKESLRGNAGAPISKAQFTSSYNSGLNSLKGFFEESQLEFASKRNQEKGYYDLSLSDRISLYNSPGTQAFLEQVDPSGESLKCRFDRCFIDGPRNTRIASLVAVLGVTIISFGTASPFIGAVAAIGGAALSANEVQNSCFKSTLNTTAQNEWVCTPEHLARTSLALHSNTQCAVDMAMLALDVTIPGIAGLRSAARARQLARAEESSDAAAALRVADDAPPAPRTEETTLRATEAPPSPARSAGSSGGYSVPASASPAPAARLPAATPSNTNVTVNFRTFDNAGVELTQAQLTQIERMELNNLMRFEDETAGFYGRVRNRTVTPRQERAMTLEHVTERFRAWDEIRPGLSDEVTLFLNGITDRNIKRQFTAILLNSPNGNPIETLGRLRRYTGTPQTLSKDDYLTFLRDRIRQIDQTAPSSRSNADALANERSALEMEALFIERGENLRVEGIFSAKAHNQMMRGDGRDAHSLEDSFNVDIRVRGENLPLCRGSVATRGLASGIAGGFFKPGCTPNYVDRGTNVNNAAAPVDATDIERLQGYSRMNALEFDSSITIGRNGRVHYNDKGSKGTVYEGTGGAGGDLEAFPSRLGNAPKVDNLTGSVRTLTCQDKYGDFCRTLLEMQRRIATRSLGPDAVSVLEAELVNIRRILAEQTENARRAVRDVDNLGVAENLNGLNRAYPDLLSALNVEQEILLKLERARANPSGYPRGRFPLDAETTAFRDGVTEANRFSGEIKLADAPQSMTGARAALTQALERANQLEVVQNFRTNISTVNSELARLEPLTTSANPLDDLRSLTRAAGRSDDMYMGVRGISEGLRGQIRGLDYLSDAEKLELERLVADRLPGFQRERPAVLYQNADDF